MVDSNLTVSVTIDKESLANDLEEIGAAFLHASEEIRDTPAIGINHPTVDVDGD